jgi:5-hydroxyisourate hydrolase
VSRVSTHVLDVTSGAPAAGIEVRLESAGAGGAEISRAQTGTDGRAVLSESALPAGVYRLVFDTGGAFFPEVSVTFVAAAGERYHIPLLLSPFGYTTYRGS